MSELTLYRGEVFDFIDSPLEKMLTDIFPMEYWSYGKER